MKRLMVGTASIVFLLATKSYAQSGVSTPQGDADHGAQASCVILRRIGRIGRAESRLSSFGIRGKQFRYVEGKLPQGFSSHGKMTNHDVRNLQAHGAQVLVLESNYTSDDLKEARTNCFGETAKTASQEETKASTAQAPPTQSQVQAQAQAKPAIPSPPPSRRKADDSGSSSDTVEAALVDIASTPTDADVDVDGSQWGKTPSTMILSPGSHEIAVKKDGFQVWRRKLKLSSGHTNLAIELVPKKK